MATKKKQKVDWLINWDKTYDWSGKSATQIAANKKQIEAFVSSALKVSDDGQKIAKPSFKGHKIRFAWFAGPGSEFIVSAYLTPSAKETGPNGGSGNSQLSPTPPPQP